MKSQHFFKNDKSQIKKSCEVIYICCKFCTLTITIWVLEFYWNVRKERSPLRRASARCLLCVLFSHLTLNLTVSTFVKPRRSSVSLSITTGNFKGGNIPYTPIEINLLGCWVASCVKPCIVLSIFKWLNLQLCMVDFHAYAWNRVVMNSDTGFSNKKSKFDYSAFDG